MPGVRGRSGGTRPNAGRKAKAQVYRQEIKETEAAFAQALPAVAKKLVALALGKETTIIEDYTCAALLRRDDFIEQDGKQIKVKEAAFPHLKGTDMVLVRRRAVRPAPSLPAMVKLVERILGTPYGMEPEEPEEEVAAPEEMSHEATKAHVEQILLDVLRTVIEESKQELAGQKQQTPVLEGQEHMGIDGACLDLAAD